MSTRQNYRFHLRLLNNCADSVYATIQRPCSFGILLSLDRKEQGGHQIIPDWQLTSRLVVKLRKVRRLITLEEAYYFLWSQRRICSH